MQDLIETLHQSRHGTKERLSVRKQFAIVFVPVRPGDPHVYPVEDNMYRGSLGAENMGILNLLHQATSGTRPWSDLNLDCVRVTLLDMKRRETWRGG